MSTPTTVTDETGVLVVVGDASFTLRDAAILSWGELVLVAVADRPIACDQLIPGDHLDRNRFGSAAATFELSRGPGNGTYDGRKVGTQVRFHSADASETALPHLAMVSLDEFSSGQDVRVHGTMQVASRQLQIDGDFEARVCDDMGDRPQSAAPPLSETDGAITAELVSLEHFVPKSALAVVHHDVDNDVDFVSSIQFFDALVDCNGLDTSLRTLDSLAIDLFGFSTRHHPSGIAIPAAASFHFQRPAAQRPQPPWLSNPPDVLGSQGWIRFDADRFPDRGTLTGVADLSSDGLTLHGRFEATVCRN